MATTIWAANTTPTFGPTGLAGYSFRSQHVLTGASLGQVRVTFLTNDGQGTVHANNCSIGVVGASTAPNCDTNPPVELTFGGGSHGFSIPNNSPIVSDWVNLAALSTDKLLVIMDLNADTAGSPYCDESTGAVAQGWNSGTAAASYTNPTVTGYTSQGNVSYTATLIETQAAAGAPIIRRIRGAPILPWIMP